MPGEKVLGIEDDKDIQELIKYNLQRESYDATANSFWMVSLNSSVNDSYFNKFTGLLT